VGQYQRYESAVVRVGYLLLLGVTASLLAAAGATCRRRVISWFLVGCAVASIEAGWEWIAFRLGLAGGLARPDGNLGNAALLRALDAMASTLLVGRVLRGEWRWAPVLALALAGLAASTSRSAWLGALIGGLVVLGMRMPLRRLRWAATGGALALLLAAVLAVGALASLNSDPHALRLAVWGRVLPLILARPIFGWGEDTMGLILGAH
jgi:hypothetical protein